MIHLPHIFNFFKQKKPEKKTVYLSLALTPSTVLAAVWHMDKEGRVEIVGTASDTVLTDSWDERLISCDHVISTCEAKVGPSEIKNVILGLSEEYLSPEGEISQAVRAPIKKILTSLGLTALGFVGLDSALAFYFKKIEGIPPSCIFIHCGTGALDVTLYSVGQKLGREQIIISGQTILDIEKALKTIAHSEILPPRIMLYGMNEQDLEEFRRQLIKHPWTAKLQFLHFPKIESVSGKIIAKSVVMAGASELVQTVSEKGDIGEDVNKKVDQDDDAFSSEEETEKNLQASNIAANINENVTMDVVEDDSDTQENGALSDEKTESQKSDFQEIENETSGHDVTTEDENNIDTEEISSEHANVEIVDPEELGFHTESVGKDDDDQELEEENTQPKKALFVKPNIHIGKFFSGNNLSSKKRLIIIGGVVLLLVCAGFGAYQAWAWFIPKAIVTIAVIPKTIEKSGTVIVSSSVTAIDPEKKIIPGKKIDRTVSGEKTATVSGKKKVGDPARGTVTIYNKSLSEKVLKKGSVFTFGSLSFTLDSEALVASASESIGSITFGKATALITASSIGAESNLSPNSELVSKEFGGNICIARNEQALTGGTSKDITVVTSADYAGIISSLTAELSEQAKSELTQESTEGLSLIDGTISVSKDISKTFDKELDQEAKSLTGKVTITISGIGYDPNDMKSLFRSLVKADVPSGYVLNEQRESLSTEKPKIAKDGSITLIAKIQSAALPVIDEKGTAVKIAGKTESEFASILKNIPGISDVSVDGDTSLPQGKLPKNPSNIKIKISVSE